MESNRIEEQATGHAKSMKLRILNEVAESLCKIKRKGSNGSGFFLKIEDIDKILYFLVTASHVLSNLTNEESIEIDNDMINIKQSILLKNNERIIEIFKEQDLIAIEIIDKDNLKGKIRFLNYDTECKKERYIKYLNIDAFILHYPNGEDLECSSGKIIKIQEPKKFEFQHTLETDKGSSGAPILLFEKQNEEPKVIGVHTSALVDIKNNVGTFIDVLIDKLKDRNKIMKHFELIESVEDKNEINDKENEKVADDLNSVKKEN